MDILLALFNYHNSFDLRSLEGVFIVFEGPCLVDRFGRTSLVCDSLGLEAHRLDTMAHTPKNDGILWSPERHLGGSILAHFQPNIFLLR
jgi:hypothetical protein